MNLRKFVNSNPNDLIHKAMQYRYSIEPVSFAKKIYSIQK